MDGIVIAENSSAIVKVEELTRWDQATPLNPILEPQQVKKHKKSPFQWNSTLNKKIILWSGDICSLNVHAIVHSTNEAISDPTAASNRLFARAGIQLQQEIRQTVRVCKTGDAKMTKGYNLPARHVIHTVGPRYNVRYLSAAQSALYSCYRRTLQLVRENKLASVAFCVINSERRGYPPDEGAHIALRTVRRFLDRFGDTIDTVVFVVDGIDADVYQEVLPMYFPRNKAEEEYACYFLPEDVGNDDGEPYVADRQIRILDKPRVLLDGEAEENTELLLDPEVSSIVGNLEFTRMMGDRDSQRMRQGSLPTDELTLEAQGISRYERLLRKARTEDLTDIARTGCLYQSGFDRLGRPVLVFIGRWFEYDKIDLEKALLYLVQTLFTAVKQDYVIVYFHTQTSSENRPSMAWIREVYSVLEYKYRKNLKALYVVHPSFWTKLMTWWFTTFMAPTIKDKVHNLGGLEYLYAVMDVDQLQVPTFIREYDMTILSLDGHNGCVTAMASVDRWDVTEATTVNGVRYYTPGEDDEDLLVCGIARVNGVMAARRSKYRKPFVNLAQVKLMEKCVEVQPLIHRCRGFD